MILGIWAAELLVEMRAAKKISFVARPIVKFARLPEECGVSFLTTFVSPAAANSMLAEYFNRGFIGKRELFIASLLNSFPAIVMHWRPMLPILLPLLGFVGLLYFLLLVLIGLVKTLLIMAAGRALLGKKETRGVSSCFETPAQKAPPLREAAIKSFKSALPTMKSVCLWTIPAMIASCILIKAGAFDLLSLHLQGLASRLPIPPSGIGIISAQFGNLAAASAVAASLMASGEISAKGVILSLLAGNILTSLFTALRFLFPYYIGIFGLRIGTELLSLSSTIRNAIALLFLFALAKM